MRKARGLTIDRIPVATTLYEVCGGEDQSTETLRERLISAIESLPEPQRRDALLAAYGVLPSTQGLSSLNERRDAYGKQIHRKRDTLANREDVAIKELALRLLASYYAGAPLPA